jgi:dTMP kinase
LQRLAASHQAVVLDRYSASNLAYQGAKADGPARAELIEWLDQVEHGVYRLPRADLNVFLDVPVETAMGLVLRKRGRTYTDKKLDIHEANGQYLLRCREAYMELIARGTPGPWVTVECVDAGGEMLDTEAIRDRILDVIRGRVCV